MDEHKELVKQHYDKHVKGLSTQEALQQRRQGVALPLKKFHNEIKRRLISRFANGAGGLLDYACGRGGDIHKWKSANIKYVKGVDLSPAEIQEAQRRFEEMKMKDPDMMLDADFEHNEHLGDEEMQEEQEFDAVTCMFALHYFFEKEPMIKTFLQNVANNLKPGGYFFGTVPDGKRVVATLRGNKEFHSPLFHLYQRWEGKHNFFGCGYTMEIADTVVEGHGGDSQGSPEFLVFQNVLTTLAASVGLHPVTDYGDTELMGLFEEGDAQRPYKHFKPSFPSDTHVSLTFASQVYMAFVFQKVDSPADATPPPLPSAFQPPLPSTATAGPPSNGHYPPAPGPSGRQQAPYSGPGVQQQHQQQPPGPPIYHDPHAAGQPGFSGAPPMYNAQQYQQPGPGSGLPPGGHNPPHMPPHMPPHQQHHQQHHQQYPQQQYPQQQFGHPGQPPLPHTGQAPLRQGPLPTAYAINKGLVPAKFMYHSRPLPEPLWQFGTNYSDELDSGRAATAAVTAKLLERARAAAAAPQAHAAAHGAVQSKAPGQQQQQQQQQAQAQVHALGAAAGPSNAPAQGKGTKRPYEEMAGAVPSAAGAVQAAPSQQQAPQQQQQSALLLQQQQQQQQQQEAPDDDPAGYGRQAVSYEDMYDDDDTAPAVGPQYAAR